MMVNFIMFSLMTAGMAMIMERKNGTLRRLMTTRVRRWELIAGKMAGMFALTFVQQILLIGVGQLFFGVDYLNDPAALLLMMVALSLVASSLGLLLAVAAHQRAGARRRHRHHVDERLGAVGRLVPARDHRPGLPVRRPPAAHGVDPRRPARHHRQGYGVSDVLPAFGVALAWSAGLFGAAVARFRLS